MADILEGTPEFNRHHANVTGPVPIIKVSDDERLDMFEAAMQLAHEDDEPLECGLENPDTCESCT